MNNRQPDTRALRSRDGVGVPNRSVGVPHVRRRRERWRVPLNGNVEDRTALCRPDASTRRAQVSARADESASSNHSASRWSLRSSTSERMGDTVRRREGLMHRDISS